MSGGIRCFWLEPTTRLRRSLRRYHSCAGAPGRGACSPPSSAHNCPRGGYHNAMVPLDEIEAVLEEREFHGKRLRVYSDAMHQGPPHDDPRWPVACACAFVFFPDDPWQVFHDAVYRRADTGEFTTLRDAPPGAMWNAEWLADVANYRNADGLSLVVKVPGGHDWHVDGIASNCGPGHAGGRPAGKFCWQRSGTVPNITVARGSCPTAGCGVGGGSIGAPGWHGYLTAGELVTG